MSKYADIEQIKEVIRIEWVRYMPMELDVSLSFVLGKIAEVPTIEVSEDCIDRYSALAELDPRSYEYKAVKELPSVVPKTQIETQNSNENSNVISVYDGVSEAVRCAMCSNPNKSDRGCDGACSYDEKLYKRIMDAINASKVEVSDCISRVDLFEKMQSLCPETDKGCGDCYKACDIEDCLDFVINAPSVVPSRAEGEWIVKANGNNECSICGREKQNGWVNFCGFCGSKMKG